VADTRNIDAGTKLLTETSTDKKRAAESKTKADAVKSDPRKADAGTSLVTGRPTDKQRGLVSDAKPQRPTIAPEPSRDAGTVVTKPPIGRVTEPPGAGSKARSIVYPGAQGRNVWAFRAGNFVDKGNGWDQVIPFSSLADINKRLADSKLNGGVARLGIVAHGDAPGQVQLEGGPLTPETIAKYTIDLLALQAFLKSNGKLIFVSCIAAKDQAGSRLLTGLSKILTNRYVIGFEIFGGFNRYFSAPGDVYEDPHGSSSGAPLEKQTNLIRLTEASIYSKWALNGAIIRLPLSEVSKAQKGKEPYRCANPACPGHKTVVGECDVFP